MPVIEWDGSPVFGEKGLVIIGAPRPNAGSQSRTCEPKRDNIRDDGEEHPPAEECGG
jgi:hypothetical protein